MNLVKIQGAAPTIESSVRKIASSALDEHTIRTTTQRVSLCTYDGMGRVVLLPAML